MAQRKRRRSHVNIPMAVAAVLLCLTLFSAHLAGGVFARYTVTSSASDSARVIKFGDITLTTYGGTTQYIAPGAELVWNADVSFEGSEAATYVFLEVTPGNGFAVSNGGMTYTMAPDAAAWTVDGGTEDNDWKFLQESGGTYVYYLSLAPNEELTKKALFTNTDNVAVVRETLTAADLTTVSAFTTSFRASVVQSNGFGSVDDAWTSLSTNH